MGEETPDAMNLDLNLGPGPVPVADAITNEAVNFDWIEEPIHRISEAVRRRVQRRWRWRQLHNPVEAHVHIPPEARNVSMELNQFVVNSGNGSALQAGEGSAAAEERTEELPKACENNNGVTEDEISEKQEDVERGSSNDGGFFDCNICLDLAREPVVTCCGHLFCWPCVYRWLNVHSEAKECPVCKGEVSTKNVTPIYGRGNNVNRRPDEDSTLKIPPRPYARRVESLRQTFQRNAFAIPVEEMIRRLGSRIDLTQDLVQSNDPDNARETPERTSSLLSRFLTSQGMRRDNLGAPPDDAVGLTQNNEGSPVAGDNRRVQSVLLRRTQSHRATLSSLSSALNSAERLVEAYFRSHSIDRNQEQPPPVDDRDSFSSIAAVINSESQVDTAVEIDSMGSLSTSSSRRRNEASRVSDVDSGDSRAPRRRRLLG